MEPGFGLFAFRSLSMENPGAMARSGIDSGRRWLLIQLHRAQIARASRVRSSHARGEIAQRMNAIAVLCDCGRTESGQKLALMLAQGGGPDVRSLLLEHVELTEPS